MVMLALQNSQIQDALSGEAEVQNTLLDPYEEFQTGMDNMAGSAAAIQETAQALAPQKEAVEEAKEENEDRERETNQAKQISETEAPVPPMPKQLKTAPVDPKGIHVCFCTDDPDLRQIAVAINSTLRNTRAPKRLYFHVVTSTKVADHFQKSLNAVLPHARIEVHYDEELQTRIASTITFRKRSGARPSLQSTFNFAPFYLDAFLRIGKDGSDASRLIYLDTDVVINGDILDLHELDLQGHAVAAVEDCSQKFEIYIDMALLRQMGLNKRWHRR
jgi:hypothetical protein